jgi:DNA-binding GntR family transcriptional regulator
MSSPAPPDAATAAAALRPLDRYVGTLAQRVYLSLRESILALEFRPGEALRKPEICAALGVSRSPVSEAVARLAAEALVDVAPQSGTFVARLSMAEIREGAFMRAALELAAVERVAETLTAEQATLLRRNLRLQEALVADGDVAGFHEADTAMHALILSFTGFRRLTGVTQSAWVHVDRAVIEALEAHDPAAARAALRHHLGQLLGALEGVMRARPELFDDAIDPEA